MTLLEQSQSFFYDCVAPLIDEQAAFLWDIATFGLIGEGSECFGWDDAQSKDHDWGIRIMGFIDEAAVYEEALSFWRNIENQFPTTYQGMPVNQMATRSGLFLTADFLKRHLNTAELPQTVGQWLKLPDEGAALMTNGKIFHAVPGQLMMMRELLQKGKPLDILKYQLAVALAKAGQAGEYNFMRMHERGDDLAAIISLNQFTTEVLKAWYLMNDGYTPFYKWLSRGAQTFPEGDVLTALLTDLYCAPYEEQLAILRKIAQFMIMKLQAKKLTTLAVERPLIDVALDVQGHIQHTGLREMNIWSRF